MKTTSKLPRDWPAKPNSLPSSSHPTSADGPQGTLVLGRRHGRSPIGHSPPPSGQTALLHAHSVSKRFDGGVQALQDIDLSVYEGEAVALIGESGSGKTTLLRTFNRLVDPTSGEIEFSGRPLTSFDPIDLRRRLGYVQQEGGLIPHWNVFRNVALVPSLLGWPAEKTRPRVHELLDLVDLPPDTYSDRYPRTLSGGQRQRVAIARALAADPAVVLLDEPFGALDPLTRGGMQDEFHQLQKRLGKTIVFVTHDLEEAFYLADRVAVMYQGRIEQTGGAKELRENPTSEYVKRLLQRHRRHLETAAGESS